MDPNHVPTMPPLKSFICNLSFIVNFDLLETKIQKERII